MKSHRKSRPKVQTYNDGRTCKASHYIARAKVLLSQPNRKVVLWVRVSGREQKRKHNPADQEAYLRHKATKRGFAVVGVVLHTGSGWVIGNPDFLRAVRMARRRGAILLAETTDRFVRHKDYHSDTNFNAQASESQLAELSRLADGVVLATYLHPDASPARVRRFQSKRGQWAKDNKGGRPLKKRPGYLKDRKTRLLPRVVKLYEQGHTLREIARRVSVPHTTIRNWLKA